MSTLLSAASELQQTARGVAGYAADVWLLATTQFENPRSYLKFRIIDAVRRTTGAHTFIEAGTSLAVTAQRAAAVFDKVYTIELSPELASSAARRLAHKPNVRVIRGDALELIPGLLRTEDVSRAIVFLDSHPCGPTTAEGTFSEPAVEELRRLSGEAPRLKALIVDDFRLFGTEPGYPSKSQLLEIAEQLYGRRGFEVRVQFDQLVLVARD